MWRLLSDFGVIDSAWLTTLGVIAAAMIGGFVSVLVARRATSGSTATSDAATLWNAAETIRLEQREHIEAQDKEIVHLKERVAVLESQNRDQAKRIHDLEAELAHLRGVVGE